MAASEIPLDVRPLDLGCGLGLWREALAKYAKRVRYTGVEFSSHLCRKLGWERGDVRTYSPGRTFDLVICQAVLQYLPDDECELAIENLARLSRRFLFLEVLTAADAREICAPEGTDFDVYVRDASWYAASSGRSVEAATSTRVSTTIAPTTGATAFRP